MKIAGIFYIKDIGVLLYVPLCVGFGKFTFSDSGDSAKENMTAVSYTHLMYISRIFCEKHGGNLKIYNARQGGAHVEALFKAE